MVNCNGAHISEKEALISFNNRGYTYGDALFETIRVNSGKIIFWEDHYFRLMASMRILRMQIPLTFTPEFLSDQIQSLIEVNGLMNASVRIKLIVNLNTGGLYTPETKEISYYLSVAKLDTSMYTMVEDQYEVTLFKDHYVAPDLLSTIKSNNKLVNILAGIFAKENEFDNCLLLNTNKMVLEALNGNLFLVKGNIIKTPKISDGCLKGILRTQLIRIIDKHPDFELEEASISPFELQKADELFITNVIQGIRPITKFRKKTYENTVSKKLLGLLNANIRLNK